MAPFLRRARRVRAPGIVLVAALYNGQFAISDLTRGTFDYDTLNDSLQPDNVPAGGGYNTTINTWNMHGSNGWEGDSAVTGTIGGQPVTGQSYVEVQPTFSVPQPGDIGALLP